jgi:hypothetical protein
MDPSAVSGAINLVRHAMMGVLCEASEKYPTTNKKLVLLFGKKESINIVKAARLPLTTAHP